jgi:hypothetical protein
MIACALGVWSPAPLEPLILRREHMRFIPRQAAAEGSLKHASLSAPGQHIRCSGRSLSVITRVNRAEG